MPELISILENIGVESLNHIWFPLFLWTIAALIAIGILRWLPGIDTLQKYHLRVALIGVLPIGLTAAWIINTFIPSFFPTSSSFFQSLVVIKNPVAVDAETAAQTVDFTNPYLWLGLSTVLIFLGSLLTLMELLRNHLGLRKFSRSKNAFSLDDLDIISAGNRNLAANLPTEPILLFSEEISIPFTFGWKSPTIVVPSSFRSDEEKLNLTIRHELTHIKRADYLLNSGILLIKSIFWFHPLIYYLHNSSKEYRELSCDREVLTDPGISKKNYAELLLELANKSVLSRQTVVSMSVSTSTLKKRINTMKALNHHPPSIRKSILYSFLLTIVLTGFISCSDLENEGSPSDQIRQPHTYQMAADTVQEKNVYTVVEEPPQLKDGINSIQKRIHYPEEAYKAGVEGRLLVRFIVNEQGEVESPEVVHGELGYGCEEAALEAIKQAKFKPGKQKGEPVRVKYTLPVIFKLPDDAPEDDGQSSLLDKSENRPLTVIQVSIDNNIKLNGELISLTQFEAALKKIDGSYAQITVGPDVSRELIRDIQKIVRDSHIPMIHYSPRPG